MSANRARLGDLAYFNPPTPKGLLASDTEVAIVPMAAVSEQGRMQVHEYRAAKAVSSGLSYFSSGDVLVAKITPCYENNKIAQALVDREHAFGSTEFHVLRPDKNKIDGRYITHFLRQDAVRQLGVRRMTGSGGQRRVPRSFLEELEIPLPPLDEQRRIAAILDQADALRRKRRQAVDHLNRLNQAIFLQMFGQSDDDVSVFDYIDEIQSGRNLVGVDDDQGSGFRVLKISAVSRNGFRADETKPLPPSYTPPPHHIVNEGDLLFSRANTRELVGIPCIVEGVHPNIALPDKLWRLVPSPTKAMSTFICHALLSQSSRRQIEQMCSGTSGSMQNISTEKFKRIRVPKAALPDQAKFCRNVERVSAVMRLVKKQGDEMDALFTSLQHRAFRGQL